MTTVDNRIVEMQFDNKQFESGVSTTLGSLKKLKEGLNFKDSTKSLDNLESKSKKINFSTLASGVENISSKFTTLGIIGVTALQNITNSAVDAGKRITEALTIEPIKLGFEEYETQINAVQTILANTSSKGTTLDQVNSALNELNRYADLTIYNFTEMTRNIGTFTAAGVDLDTSVSAIKGIANLAAVSGSSSQQASTAMYQLSQALAAGTVKLMDWNSVVNAGMGGQVFQESLMETARVHGIAIDQMIKEEGSFRETLSKGWLSSEILTETLSKFTGDLTKEQILSMGYTEQQAEEIMKLGQTANDAATKVKTFTQLGDTLMEAMQSGWTQSWEYIIGDFEEAKESLTTISGIFENMIQSSADSRNAILKEWHDLGGRDDLWAGLIAGIQAVMSYIEPLKEGFREIIPPITGERLAELTKGFRNFMENAGASSETAERLRNVAKALATVIKNVFNALTQSTGGLSRVWEGLKTLANGFLSVVEAVLSFFGALTSGEALGSIFSNTIGVIGDGLGFLGRALSGAASLVTIFASALANLTTSAGRVVANLTGGTSSAIIGFVNIIQTIISTLPSVVGTAIKAIGDVIRSILTDLPIHEVNKTLQESLFTVILFNVNSFISKLKKNIKETGEIATFLSKIADSIGGVFDTLTNSIKTMTTSVKVDMLLKIAAAVGILAASLWLLSGIPIDQLASSLGMLVAGFLGLSAIAIGVMAVLKRMSGSFIDIVKLAGMAYVFRNVATSVLILSVAIKLLTSSMEQLADLSWEGIAKGLVSLAGLMAIMVATSKIMSSVSGFIRGAASLVILAAAIRILTGAFIELAGLSLEEIGKGLIALAGSLALLIGTLALLNALKGSLIKSAASLIIFGIAMKMFANAIKDFSSIEYSSMVKAAASLILIAGALAIFSATMQKMTFKSAITSVMELGAYTAFIKNLADSVAKFDQVSTSGIIKSIVSIGLILAALSKFSNSIDSKGSLYKAASLLVMSAAINEMSRAFKTFGELSIGQVAKSLISLAGGLTAMVVALNAMPDKTMLKAISLTVFASALKILADSLKTMGSMRLSEIGKSMLTLASSLTIMGIAMKAMSNGGIWRVGASLMLVSIGMSMLAGAIMTLGSMPLADMAQGLLGFAAALTILGVAAKALGGLSGRMIKASAGIAVFGASMVVFGIGLSALIWPITKLAQLTGEQLVGSVSSLAAVVGVMATLSQVMNSLPNFSVKNLAKLGLMSIAIGLIGAIINQVAATDAKSALAGATAIAEVLLTTTAALYILQGLSIKGAITAIAALAIVVAGIGVIVTAMGALAQIPGAKWLVSEGKNFLQSIGEAIGGFFGGIVGGAIAAASSSLPTLGKNLSSFTNNATPFFNAMSSMDTGVTQGVKNLAQAFAILVASNIFESAYSWLTGGNSMVKFGQELSQFAPYFKRYADTISGIDVDAVEGSTNAAKALSEFANNLPKTGGLVQLFTGQGSLTSFASQLVPFGEALKGYSDAISGIDSDAVSNSATAAQALAELANQIPKFGGLIDLVMGSSDIAEFGNKLIPFGESLKQYADSVSGIDADSIASSASAAQALADVANSLDETGGVVGWFMGDKDFGGFAENVAALGEGLKAYAESVGDQDFSGIEGSISAVKALAEISNSLGTSGSIFEVFNGSNQEALKSFSAGMPLLGEGIAAYAESVGQVSDYSNIDSSAQALKTLSELAQNLGTSGGIGMLFVGTTKDAMGQFAEGLGNLGRGITAYASEVQGASFENVEASANAIKTLSSVADSLGTAGGLGDLFAGTTANAMSQFADGLGNLGKGISEYASEVQGASFENVDTSAEALKSLASASEYLSNEGGLASLFTGSAAAGMSMFADNLGNLGSGIGAYAEAVQGKDFSNVSPSVDALMNLAQIQNGIGNEGGLGAIFAGSASAGLTMFGDALGSLGSGIAAYADGVAGHDFSMVEASVTAIQQVSDVFNSLNELNTDGIIQFSDTISNLGDMGLSEFNDSLAETAQSVATNMTELSNAISTGAGEISSAIENLKSTLSSQGGAYTEIGTELGRSLADGIGQGIRNNQGLPNDALKAILDYVQSNADSRVTKFKSTGEKLVNAINTGIKSKQNSVNSTINSLFNNISINTSRFVSIGEQVGNGIIQGINNKRSSVMSAAQSIANAASNTISSALQVKSPSRVTTRIGEYTAIGLANGIEHMANRVEDSARYVALTAVNETAAIVAAIGQGIDDNMDLSPKITPVLDLSNLENSGLLTGGLGLSTEGLKLYAGSIQANSRFLENQNGTEMLLDRLEEKIDTLSDNIVDALDTNPVFEMYVDGKQLASSIAKPMNRKLGSISKSRGISS